MPRISLVLIALLLAGPAAAAPAAVELCRVTPAGLNDNFVQPESTKHMVELVQEIYRTADPMRNPFRGSDQIPLLREKVQTTSDPAHRFDTKMALAGSLLQTGDTDGALREFASIRTLLQEHNLPPNDQLQIVLLTNEALCHLRAGEQANCLANHNADSCIFPIQGGGVHLMPEGSRAAVRVLTELLTKYPGDLRARWLLNIAYMTLGEYPDKVPQAWLIDPKSFASEAAFPRYPDVAANVGLNVDGLAGGIVMEDFDHDGLLDVMISHWGFTPAENQIHVFRNNGDGTFTDRTKEAGLTGVVSGLNLIHADYNNDGFADVLVLRGAWLRTEGHYPVSLLRNNGDFTFTDVTAEANLLSHLKPSQAAAWLDFNGDGWLDLFIANESAGRDSNPCELFRNNGDGTFTDIAAECGVDLIGFYKGVVAGDYNNDGRPDLFISNREGARVLLRNDGPAGADHSPQAPWKFTDVTEAAGITGPTNSFPCWFWDYDNDGWLDIMVTGYQIQNAGDIAADYLGRPHTGRKAKLYHNNGDGTFTDVSKATGVNRLLHAMGANFGDLDNDGWLDFYVGTGDPDFGTLLPNRMFKNDGGKRFQDVTTAGGFGQLQKGHGIAFGDLNNDGAQDIFSVVGGAFEADHYHSQLFANPGNANHWVKLQLEGVRTNRVAIGARVKVVVRDGGAERAIHRVVGTGASFGSNPLRVEVGLGAATQIVRVEVFWPVTGQTQVFSDLQVDHAYHLCEGTIAAAPMVLKSFAFPTAPAAGAHHHHAP